MVGACLPEIATDFHNCYRGDPVRKVILQEFVTLDGLAAGPNGSVDFVPAATQGDRSFGQEQLELMNTVDTILLGRVTYRMFAGHWPSVTEGEEKPFADKLNSTPKIVFSRTLDRAPWGTWDEARIVKNNAADEVANLKQQSGKDMLIWGSISLAQSLINDGLIDEYRLVVCPVVLGNGRPLFGDQVASTNMKLLDAKTLDLGAVSLKYIQAKARSADARGPRTVR
jgi:dihydrofolate reductase